MLSRIISTISKFICYLCRNLKIIVIVRILKRFHIFLFTLNFLFSSAGQNLLPNANLNFLNKNQLALLQQQRNMMMNTMQQNQQINLSPVNQMMISPSISKFWVDSESCVGIFFSRNYNLVVIIKIIISCAVVHCSH